MKLPNNYGSIIKLSGNRRKPYAVRVSYETQENGQWKLKRKYVGYFTTKALAIAYLTDYNAGNVIEEHKKYVDEPTFSELYYKWKDFRKSLKSNPSASTWKNYDIAFKLFNDVHTRKIISLKPSDLQECLNKQSNKSKGTISSMKIILKNMWQYAINNEMIDKDITTSLVFEYTSSSTSIHTHFTEEEIKLLWNNLGIVNNVDIVLIYIYTGLRPAELLEIKSENVHIDARYMVGGIKTEAGKNRIIPLHKSIVPLVENRLAQNRPTLISNKYGNQYTRAVYHNTNWNTVMNKLDLHHSPHDARYTFAYLADKYELNQVATKIIMGHSISNIDSTSFKMGSSYDITKGVYTEKTINDLLIQVDKISV